MIVLKLLLVEDEIALIRGISFALKKEGFEIETADTISSAKKLIDSKKFDLILLDINLPDGLGFDLCEKVRTYSNIPIIFLTASQSELDVMNGLDIGGDDYITKPFSVCVLISRVNALLRRVNKIKDKWIIESKDIKFYEREMRVKKKDKDIELTKREMKLIHFFMNNPQIILSKEKILESVWDCDGDFVDENVVAVNIGRLRNKVEEIPSNPEYIQNIRGVGYIWAQECIRR